MTSLASRMSRVAPSAIMELLKAAAAGGYINFASGLPDASLFPHDKVQAITADILADDWKDALQYGAAEGYPPLRELVAERLTQRGLRATADNILITHGSQQALDLAARLYLDKNNTVLIECPTYLAAIQAFDSYEVSYASVPLDKDGVDADDWINMLRKLVREEVQILQFLLPNFQNPTGITLSMDRRGRIAEAAAELKVPLLEDDAYYDLRYEGENLLPISALADNPLAMYTGTFSKTIAPGIRVGWVYGSKNIISRMAQLKQICDLHSGSLTQRIAFEFCRRGFIDLQIQFLREVYGSKCNTMLQALEREMPDGISWTRPAGGMFLFLTLPEEIDCELLLKRAMKEKLMFVPGRSFFPSDNSRRDGHSQLNSTNTLRLNFVSAEKKDIDCGISMLASLICEG